MNELQDFLAEIYDPAAVMARVGHLPHRAQQDVEQISRIIRGAFGYGEADMPEQGRIVSLTLTGPCARSDCAGEAITAYDFHIDVNLAECADEAHWRFARRLIASEIGEHRAVNLVISTKDCPAGIVLYDAAVDLPLNTRELSCRP
jgi:hypothetical protein